MVGHEMNLKSEHEEMREAMRRFAALLEQPAALVRRDLLRERVTFFRTFTGHVGSELALIDLATRRSGAEITMSVAEDYRARIVSLRQDYSRHINSFSPDRIETDWLSYVASVKTLQERFQKLMEWEERTLYPTLGSMGEAVASEPVMRSTANATETPRSVGIA